MVMKKTMKTKKTMQFDDPVLVRRDKLLREQLEQLLFNRFSHIEDSVIFDSNI